MNAYLNKLNGALNWAEIEGMIPRNPAKGLRVTDPVKRRDKRRPFSTEQLRLIFQAPLFTGCQDDGRGYATVGTDHPRRGRFWIPLLALHSGLRLNELCQLDTDDIEVLDGVQCLLVREGVAKDGCDKRLKTASSERIVPVHEALITMGFGSYVEAQRQAGKQKLFSELRPGSTGYYSKAFSQWFTRFLMSCEAARPQTCFHSFRHCFRDALRASGISRDIALTLGGWTNGAAGSGIADIYGDGFSPSMLANAINRISFSGVDLSHLVQIQKGDP